MTHAKTLDLICEIKIADLLAGGESGERWEASGILARDSRYYVVFDNRVEVAVVAADLGPNELNQLHGAAGGKRGYEGIAYNERKRRFYLLIEAREDKRGRYRPAIVECDEDFNRLKCRSMDFEFPSQNRGFEAVAFVRRDGQDYLLALCEGNKGKSGRAGRTPGGGRVQIFAKEKKTWAHVGEIELPKTLPFVDYSAMSIGGGRVAIASQESSMLWVGEFQEETWDWRDEGQVFEFPRTADGDVLYGNVEGVAWTGERRVAAVSDRRKDDQPDRCEAKDQSIHVFEFDRSPRDS